MVLSLPKTKSAFVPDTASVGQETVSHHTPSSLIDLDTRGARFRPIDREESDSGNMEEAARHLFAVTSLEHGFTLLTQSDAPVLSSMVQI
jgi:hypothetical protein